MAAVTVFVDKAVRGDLPHVCVRTGDPATTLLEVRRPVGGLGWAWVLLALGPPGWLILAVVSATNAGRESIDVLLPYSAPALERYRARNRALFVAWGATVVAVLAGLFVVTSPWLWLPAGAAALAVAIYMHVRLTFDEVGVRLDASRRWVTLIGVHEAFAQAVESDTRSVNPAL